MRFDDLQLSKNYGGMRAYAQSKLANLLFTYELAQRLEGTGVTVNALHPGVVATNIGRNNGFLGKLVMPVLSLFLITAEEGAQTSIYAASSPDMDGVTGKYLYQSAIVDSKPQSHDRDAQRRLWEISAEMVGL